MISITLHGLALLVFISKCQADLNVIRAVSNLTSTPFQKLTTKQKHFVQIAAEHGYHAEGHQVITDDGYILTMFRIPPRSNCRTKAPFLLMHGLAQAAEDFLDLGADSPGFVFARDCFDVWFGNVRGTYHSRKHVSLDPDKDLEFWKYSVDEIGLYDVPAMIDYVLETTGREKLIYLGVSQGGGAFIVMNSERPEYADKISLFIGLTPAAKMYHMKSIGRLMFAAVNVFQHQLESAGVWEVLAQGMPLQGIGSFLCQVEILAETACSLALGIADSPHPESITPDIIRRVIQHGPTGTSIQSIAYYGQAVNSKKFVKFNYGSEKNLELYGTPDPPAYNFKAVTMPTVIFHGLSDMVIDREDMNYNVNQLPNVVEYIKVPNPKWNHLDMTYSRYWKPTIFVPMKKFLDRYSQVY